MLKKLEEHPRFIQAHTILLYHSLPDEVDTHEFIEKWNGKKTIILPVVKGENLELYHYTGSKDLTKGPFGILEPSKEHFTNLNAIELAIIPGMAFDRQGNRLGRGKGFYDRLLPHLSSYNIGVCFSFQLQQETIPFEEYDSPMNEVITD